MIEHSSKIYATVCVCRFLVLRGLSPKSESLRKPNFRSPKSFPGDDPRQPPSSAVLDFPQFGQRIKKAERVSQPRAAAVVGQQRHSAADLKEPLRSKASNLRKRNFHAASTVSSDLANRHQRPLLKKKKKKTRLDDDVDDQLAQPARAFIRYRVKLYIGHGQYR